MEIEQHDTRPHGEFLAIIEGKEVGKLTYSWVGLQQISVKHTGTDPEFRLQGVGLALVSAAVDFAKAS
jgi:predicted GNAT family acetyltransferase